jgi:hypothetical protein
MAYTTIDDPSAYFHTQLYTGDGSSSNAITNDANAGDFKPDWIWIKNRTTAVNHVLHDSSRGASKRLYSNATDAESTTSNFSSFDTDGFTFGGGGQSYNDSSKNYVAWQWKANGGTTSSNSDGSITSTVQANTTAGFSIVTYTGNGTSGATIGHGLNSAPEWTIIRRRSDAEAWVVWHTSFGSAQSNVRLNGTDVVDTSSSGMFNNTFPTSSLITLGNGNFVNTNTETYVAYCFSEVKGYSKFGSYTGNGSTDGVFIYTGFKPAWVMFKRTSQTESWVIADNKRDTDNPVGNFLLADSTAAEGSGVVYDFLSNGIKIRDASQNESSATYIYFAFAEHPFVSSKGVPVTAR